MDKPIFFMMVGLPGGGKTDKSKELTEKFHANVHSSDAIRVEILGDVNRQDENAKVFDVLHTRVKEDIRLGHNTIYDATNINYKRRHEFLQTLNKFDCQKVCVFMATPFEMCIDRNRHRDREVPYEVIARMYKSIWIPYYYEGWDRIELVYPQEAFRFDVNELFNKDGTGLNRIPHDNPHHTYSIGQHCLATYKQLASTSPELQEAALLHDIGKPFTKSFVNSKGETTEIAHYYEHHHVSAYDSLFYSNPALNRLYIANVIHWHMRPFELERDPRSKRATDKFRRLVGDNTFSDVMLLHRADLLAH